MTSVLCVPDAVDDYIRTIRSQVNSGSRRPRTLESAVQILWEFRKTFENRNLTDSYSSPAAAAIAFDAASSVTLRYAPVDAIDL